MDFVLTIHSINRWIIVVVAVIALIKFLIGWLRSSSYQPADRGLMAAYTGLLDLQLLLGLILLIGLGLERFRIEHRLPCDNLGITGKYTHVYISCVACQPTDGN